MELQSRFGVRAWEEAFGAVVDASPPLDGVLLDELDDVALGEGEHVGALGDKGGDGHKSGEGRLRGAGGGAVGRGLEGGGGGALGGGHIGAGERGNMGLGRERGGTLQREDGRGVGAGAEHMRALQGGHGLGRVRVLSGRENRLY